MLKLSVKIALRPNKRFFFAFLGVAVCMMYVAGTSSLVGGLREGNEVLKDESGFCFYTRGDPLDASLTRTSVSSGGVSQGVLGVAVRVSFGNFSTFLVGIEGMGDVSTPEIENATGVLLGSALISGVLGDVSLHSENITLENGGERFHAVAEGVFESPMFPPDWIVASPAFVRHVAGYPDNSFSFFVTSDSVEMSDTVSQPLSSSNAFFLAGVRQVEGLLWMLTTIASLVAVLVVYNLMRVEVMARSGDIRVLSGIGGSRRWIVSVFALEGGVASFLGGLLGVVLGVVGANLMTSGFTFMGYRFLLTPYVGVDSIVFPVMAAFVVGLIGGGLAAVKAPLREDV